jgi:hypothetical protein
MLADYLIDLDVSVERIVRKAVKVGGLRGVSDDGVRQFPSDCVGEIYQPLLSLEPSILKGSSIFPVDVHSIKLVPAHIVS